MRSDAAVHQQLQQVCPQHVPVVVVVLLAVVAAYDESADTAVCQKCLVYSQICQICFDGEPLLMVQWLAWLDGFECGRRIAGIVGKRIWWQTRWQVVTHAFRLRSPVGLAPPPRCWARIVGG